MTSDQVPGPKVSVVLCGYNQAASLAEAIDSVLCQTYQNLELIVVDNGSTDGSQERLARYESEPRVQLVLHADNAPVTVRLNDAIARASGDFVSILYADDYYLPHKLERQLQEFARLDADYGVVYGPCYRLNEIGQRWLDVSLRRSGNVLEQMLVLHFTEGFINPISPLIRRECFVRYPFHEDVFVEGESIFLRFALAYKFKYIDEPLAVMREHGSNMGKVTKRNAEIALILMDKFSREPEFPPSLTLAMNAFRADFLGVCSWLGIRMAADPAWARACALEAIRRRPRQLLRPRTICAVLLSALPATAIRRFNQVMSAARTRRETVAFREDYT